MPFHEEDEALDKLLTETGDVTAELDLEELQVPRQRKPPQRYTGEVVGRVATTVFDYYRPLYVLLVDTSIQKLEERFHGNFSSQIPGHGKCAVD